MTAIRRLQKELSNIKNIIQNELPDYISAGPVKENNLFIWDATIIGKTGTPYESGIFKLSMIFPQNYPYISPKVKFLTKIFHPNINEGGEICLDILKHHWSAAYSVANLLLSISELIYEPNPSDPFNTEAANLYTNNRPEFDRIVREYVRVYAN